jgi:excisionase family DNA binding protein
VNPRIGVDEAARSSGFPKRSQDVDERLARSGATTQDAQDAAWPKRLKELLDGLVDLIAEVVSDRACGQSLDSPLLEPEEAAALLRIPTSTLLDLARRGKIPALRYGKHVRFHGAALIEAGTRHGQQEALDGPDMNI